MTKPVDIGLLRIRITIAEEWIRNREQRERAEQALRESEETLVELRRQLNDKWQFHDLMGKSLSMARLYDQIRAIAKVDATVLIEGETGTGKELVARAIHFSSARKDRPFIAVNSAGLTDSLLGSQLFGHRKGAFTGAVENQQGFFEAADGGTLFLDEIGDVPASVQTSLLRVLQEKEILRLGESKPRKVNVRVLAATHHNLSQDVAKGSFRADLLYRIRVARIQLPALRERREDIPLLAASFLSQCSAASGKPVQSISREALRVLMGYPWPGNVRELKSAIECALISCKNSVIQIEDLPSEILGPVPIHMPMSDQPMDERERLLAALKSSHGNRTTAARMLGISRATFYRRLTELNINPDG
jgi:DNA-binding NtrC family response regulator